MNKNLIEFFTYFFLTLLFYILRCANIVGVHFFALPMLIALIKVGAKPFLVAPIWLATGSFVDFSLQSLWLDLLSGAVILLAHYISVWTKKPISHFMLGVVFVGAELGKIVLSVIFPSMRLNCLLEVSLGLIVLYCFLYVLSSFKHKGIRKRYPNEEILFIGVLFFSIAVGLCNTIFPPIYFFVLAFSVLIACYCISPIASIIISIMFGLGGAVSFEDFLLLSTCVGVGSVVACIKCDSRFLIFCGEILSFILFSLYFNTNFSSEIFLSFVAGGVAFITLPSKTIKAMVSLVISEPEFVSSKVVVNKTRDELKKSLLSLSDVLLDMKNIYFNLAQNKSEEDLDYFAFEVKKRACLTCENRCLNCSNIENIKEVLTLSRAKGKISIIDAPPNLCAGCVNLSSLISAVNDVSKIYGSQVTESKNRNEKSLLLSNLCDDMSKIVHESAVVLDEKVAFDTFIENRIKDNLFSYGINCVEVVAYLKNNKLDSITLTVPLNSDEDKILEALFDVTHTDFEINEVTDGIKVGFRAINCVKCTRFDIIYGCYGGNKQNSEFSGDTFSVTKVNRKTIMFAISDGMGSGKSAHSFSAKTLDVVEDFFYLGLNSDFCIKNVNKLLVAQGEEIFSALDVGVINLETGHFDILKMGSTISFIIHGDELIRLEPSSMPLGLLSEMKPTIESHTLVDGDYVVLLSDGVVDSFKEIDVLEQELRSIKNLNPQTVAKSIVLRALEFSSEYAKDDMTALVIRIVKKLK